MTDKDQRNLDNTGETTTKPGAFKKGFDPRRWMQGRPKVPKNVKELADHLLWDILSEEIENPKTGEKVDRLRALLRSMTTSKQAADRKEILARALGAVPTKIEGTGEHGEIEISVISDEERMKRLLVLAKKANEPE